MKLLESIQATQSFESCLDFKADFIKNWLRQSCWSPDYTLDIGTLLKEKDDMPYRGDAGPPPPDVSLNSEAAEDDAGPPPPAASLNSGAAEDNAVPPPPAASLNSEDASNQSKKTTADINDTDYGYSLRLRNIFIDPESPPSELLTRAKKIISRARASPELNESVIRKADRQPTKNQG